MSQQPSVQDSDKTMQYVVKPPSGAGPGVLVLHPWWGLNPFIRSFCDRLAGQGFVVIAPDLYHGAVAKTIGEAETLIAELEQNPARLKLARQEIVQAAERLSGASSTHTIAVVGFSMGGYHGLWLAEQTAIPVVATVIFYASREGEYTSSRSAFQFHLAESDPYEPAPGVKKTQEALAAAGKEAEFYTYPGTSHWFFESDRSGAYNAEAATLAWERTVGFLTKYLV